MAVVASALVRKLTPFMPLDPLELEALGRLERGRRTVRADTDLMHERQTEHTAFIRRAMPVEPSGPRVVASSAILPAHGNRRYPCRVMAEG